MNGARFTGWLAWLGFILALASVVVLAAAGPGYRLGWWELGTAFDLFRWAAWGGIGAGAAAILALLAAIRWPSGRTVASGVAAVFLAGIAVGFPWYWLSKARSVPPIHDITTDVSDPPQFVAVLPLREDAPNPSEYGGESVAEQQKAAYPDIDTQSFSESPRTVFDAALAAAKDMGWEIVASAPGAGRIEATATTTWFGFKDDVVIRIRDDRAGTLVDVRSVSRVGRSDVGANAERIRAFQARLAGRLEGGA